MVKNAGDERLLTVKDVAARLELSVQGVHRLLSVGRIPFVNVGSAKRRRPRIRLADLMAFIRPYVAGESK